MTHDDWSSRSRASFSDLAVVALAMGIVVTLLVGLVGAGVANRGARGSPSAGSGPPFAPSGAPAPGGENGVAVAAMDLASVAAKVDPSVVDIASTLGYQNGAAAGTGIVLTPAGEVLTNNHVIEGATTLNAQVNGQGRTYDVRVLGRDSVHDVALVKLVGASGLTPIEIGDPSQVSVGDEVVAIGNAMGRGGPPSVAPGFVTALGQSITAGDPSTGTAEELTGLIEVDATLRPGDSGGPLVNGSGEIIGLDTAASMVTRFRSSSDAGFAIPIDSALVVVDQIRTGTPSATVTIGQPAFLGVQVQFIGPSAGADGYLPPASAGALITVLVPGAPAEGAGMEVGDAIVSVDGRSVDSPSALTSMLRAHHPGESVVVGWIDQAGRHRSADVRLAAGPVA